VVACGGTGELETNEESPGIEKAPLEEGLRYDSLPDIGEFVVDGREWSTTALTYFFSSGTGDISGTGEQDAILEALRLWEEATPLTFTAAGSAASADIVISFASGDHGDGFPFDGTNGVLAHAFYPPPNGGALAGDAHFDDAETWSAGEQGSSAQPIDLVTVAAHEIGHSLGLAHSSVTGALMNPFYTGSHRFLGVDDMAGIQSIYGVATAAEAGDNYGAATAMGDFNADGFADLAIGVPGQSVSGQADAGVVIVQYGAASGSLAVQIISQDSFEIGGGAEANDWFGSALAAGDFDNDGRDDLAIGVPGEAIGAANDAGAVNVLYGSTSGLNYVGNQVFYQGNDGIGGAAQASDEFGASVATGDLNGDGRDDLVIGVPGESINAVSDAGAVHVLPGSASGLVPGSDVMLYQGNASIVGTSSANDRFGTSVAVGDLNGNGFDDIVVGIPGEGGAGAIHVVFGSSSLITTTGNLQLSQGSSGISGNAEAGDSFGFSVASGDFDGNGFDDIAIGVPGEDVSGATDTGTVNFIFGSSSGPTSSGNYYLHQDSSNVSGAAANGNAFGFSLTSGDFDNDGFDDLGVGAPGNVVSSLDNAGSVYAFLGASGGPSGADEVLLHQDSSGVGGGAEAGDSFGYSVAAGDFNGDGRDDLGVGVAEEAIGSAAGSGAAHVLLGAASGVTGSGSLLFNE
jgi:hypothetical protein